MIIDPKYYLHDSDRKALDALKAIPGFSQVLKAFMKVWNEKIYYIQNMSSNLRINEHQLKKYYDMLPPICEKLGIEVPELYLELNVVPNAYTAGDTKPFIVMTSGLLETLPEYLIPTVLAHECGHIACHHVLYSTMARFIISQGLSLLGINDVTALPIQVAFYHWQRCAELSADRAAMLCDGTSEKLIQMCMAFAGFDKDICEEANVEAFLSQADEYKQLVNDNLLNRTMEFLMFSHATHPLVAVRAYEADKWAKEGPFEDLLKYMDLSSEVSLGEYLGKVPMEVASKEYLGKMYYEVKTEFENLGFKHVSIRKTTDKKWLDKAGNVVGIIVDGTDGFEKNAWLSLDADIIIEYYEPESLEEVKAAHPGQIRMPNGSKKYLGKYYEEVIKELEICGFKNFEVDVISRSKKSWNDKEGSIAMLAVNGQTQFEKGEWFSHDATIKIIYNTYNK